MYFRLFTESCNCHHYLVKTFSSSHKETPVLINGHYSFFPLPTTPNPRHESTLCFYRFVPLHISGIIWHKSFALFCTWLLSLCMFSIVTHDTEYIYFLAFYHQIICHCMDITDIINLFFSWTVFGLFLLFYLLWIKFATNIYARIFFVDICFHFFGVYN